MRLIFSLVIVSLLMISCNKQLNPANRDLIVKVGSDVLTRKDLEKNFPSGLHSEDSILAAEHYIRNWINDRLLYDMAAKNIANKDDINQLVENYKRSLVINSYQEQLVNEKISKDLKDSELLQFYEENKDRFKLDRPLIKGIFLKIPIDAPQLEKVRTWYKSLKESNIENIEKYSVQNAVVYDNFTEQWIDFVTFKDNWPADFANDVTVLRQNKYFEQQDSTYQYFLHVTEYLLPGDNAPYEYNKPIIQDMLLNQKKVAFLKDLEEDLYKRALNKGYVEYY